MTTWVELRGHSWDSLYTWADPLGIGPAVATGSITWDGAEINADWMLGVNAGVQITDSFARTSVATWGQTDTGQGWVASGTSFAASDFNVAGGFGTHSIDAAGEYRVSYIPQVTHQNWDVAVTFVAPATPTGDAIEVANMYMRAVSTASFYLMRPQIDVLGRVDIYWYAPSGALIASGIQLITLTPGSLYRVRAQSFNNVHRAKIWAVGTEEPETWGSSGVDNEYVGPGFFALRNGVGGANTNAKPIVISMDDLQTSSWVELQAGAVQVTQTLDDGMPSGTNDPNALGVSDLSTPLSNPQPTMESAARYFSPYNTSSPISLYDRDTAPIKADLGLLTDFGMITSRLFTGQMADIPITGQNATLQAISAVRQRLRKAVQPPSAYGFYEGANATWPVSYALAASGVYASPPPQPGCRYWNTFHGSVSPFLPSQRPGAIPLILYVDGLAGSSRNRPYRWVEGPFVMGIGCAYNTTWVQEVKLNAAVTGGVPFYPIGDSLISQTGKGKLEFWVKGEATDVNAKGVPGTITSFERLTMTNTNGSLVDMGITTERLLFIAGTGTGTLLHSTPLPVDDQWHFVGFAWDIAGGKRWLNIDGDVQYSTVAFTVASYPTSDTFASSQPAMTLRMATAEMQLTAGPYANPDNFPWLKDIPFIPQAVVTPSWRENESHAEPAPREAWALIAEHAQADLAWIGTTKEDVFQYLGMPYWVKTAQQTVMETLSTDSNLSTDFTPTLDPRKIFNAITLNYKAAQNVNTFDRVYTSADPLAIGTGITNIQVPLSPAAVEVRGFAFTNVAAADTVENLNTNVVSINTASDGSGSYATSAQVSAAIVSWNPGQAVIQFTNNTLSTYFLANNKQWAVLAIAAKNVRTRDDFVIGQDVGSIASRGERSLSVALPHIQNAQSAQTIANELASRLARPRTYVKGSVHPDPRRKPGWLVQINDTDITGLAGLFRITGVSTTVDGAEVRQTFTAQEAWQTGLWDSATWDTILWGA